ncbi:MAG TPA: type II toxin-antitoxin system VapC family toxin [Edaphobacter sp.]
MAFVLDASVALPWCFSDETTPFTEALLVRATGGEELFVPAHWPTEVLSALLQGKRRNRISDPEIDRFLRDLASFRVVIEESHSSARMQELRTLAEKHNLTAYDAAYLDLAKRYSLAMATFDQRLLQACSAESIIILS